jgi:hypothetical protein
MCQFDTGANTLFCWICGRHSIRDQKKGVEEIEEEKQMRVHLQIKVLLDLIQASIVSLG